MAAPVTAAGLGTLSVSGSFTPDWSAPHVPGRVLVVGGSGLSAQSLSALSTVRTQTVISGLSLAFTPSGESDEAFANRLEATGLKVQPDYVYRKLATVVNDPGYPGNDGFASGGTNVTQNYLTRVRAERAWTFLQGCSKTPAGVITAVLDTGTDAAHEDLQGRVLPGAHFVGTTAATVDEDGHGTATAGLIGATANNGKGLAGVIWGGQNLLPVKVLSSTGEGSTSTLVKGVNYAVSQGAKVINMSLGSTVAGATDKALDAALTAAADSAVLVASAGNTATDGVYYPASHSRVIAVGAVGALDGVLACYSARPNEKYPRPLDIVAPGGASNCAGATAAQQMLILAPGNKYALAAGTSESAPLVSGVASLMRAANPKLSAEQTKSLLLSSVNRANGLPLLDAEAAVRAATK
ncbi:serine protease [Deinococcus malanensis]|uniref:Serine protease n=1 Tax=Deinococcus malanensis TaxID=1706855 RepID=A0ABQ2ELQ0_9DEIO|nr:S8 family serine peptidase [Deinococcus malanensis]GGK13080.1 serine protease [Deinococcus malanensis]